MGRERREVLRGVSLEARRGEFVAIMGASGSGKSTLLHVLGLLDRPSEGKVYFEGEDVFGLGAGQQDRLRNRHIGFVFQFYHLLPELTLEENVRLPGMVEQSVLGWFGQRVGLKARARELIESVGLTEQAKQWPSTLSGGERQRAALVRALLQEPDLLLADEPTGNLDLASGKVILDILGRLNEAGQTIVMVTHDSRVAEMADRCYTLEDGVLVEDE
jgi:lipoprotein-releasing system ATP-binding protein